MINKWILNNFKSIDEKKDLELPFRQLTIFTGANSSGKSTILQSILLVTQTLQSQVGSRSIVLNGWFKKFGSYNDIVNQNKTDKHIRIGFNLSNKKRKGEFFFTPYDDDIEQVECSFEVYSSKPEEEDLQPKLDNLHIRVKKDDEKDGTLDIVRAQPSDKVMKILGNTKAVFAEDELNYKVNATSYRSRYGFMDRGNLTFFGVSFSHFLPQFIMGYYNRKERCKLYISELFLGRGGIRELPSSDGKFLQSAIQSRCMEIVEEIINENDGNRRLQNYYDKLKADFDFGVFQSFISRSNIDANRKQGYVEELTKLVMNTEDSYGLERMPSIFFPGVEYISSFFTENIKYLGPLREEPKSLYPLQENGSIMEVGLKGEHTAAVFENNKNTRVAFIDPECFNNLESLNFKVVNVPLSEAINKWLVYLQVATSIHTEERSKFGHEMRIQTDSELQQDLTHVGVGVSQVLPILVMSFLADEGSVILLEQPELHLHPKVQTRLADFFVSMNALGKQCIIETHSEYLINRLRYFVAVSETSKVADDTMIYFVEKDGGHSKYRPITINKYGVIEEWPEGFFDESEKIAAEVLRAGMEKKMKEDNEDYEE